jgi:predicted Zn-dependent peptidase
MHDAQLADRIHDRTVGPCRLLTLDTPVDEVVSWRGSFLTEPDLAAGDDVRQELVVSLLDKGTTQHDRFELARILEDRGAELDISSDGLYVDLSGRALRNDLPDILGVVAEMLFEPTFEPEEFEKARAQLAAQIRREMEKTGAQASSALARALYDPAHPNYSPPPEEQLAQLQQITRDEVAAYHDAHFGANAFILTFVGDRAGDGAIEQAVEHHFAGWTSHDTPSTYAPEAKAPSPGESHVPMPDKANIDVRMGHPLRVRRDDDDYIPLYVANYILGGNFSARLMATVRDEMGLTYGINASLSGLSTRYDGHWQIGVTLSQNNLEQGLDATRAEVERFVEDGVTADELAAKKTTITGSYTVGLATTKRLAQSILTNAERGFDLDYLDRFPALIEGLTLEEVNAAVQRHFDPTQFHTALAGTVPERAPQGA